MTLAEEGLGEPRAPTTARREPPGSLEQAYRRSEAITAHSSRSFHLASAFLPAHKRRAIRSLYAFCRITDDIVDDPRTDATAALQDWRTQALSPNVSLTHPVAIAWRDARRSFGIPISYAEQLIEGVGRDLRPALFDGFEALARYCYGVASTVGLMSMHVIGFSGPQAVRHAVKMGVALQLTNILRDVGEDLRAGRLYLPLDELAAFDIQPDQLFAGRVDRRWQHFMRFQIGRARRLFQEAWPGIRHLHRDGRFAVATAADLYAGILDKIETNGHDVFSRRAHLSAAEKVLRLPVIWFRTRYGIDGADRRREGR